MVGLSLFRFRNAVLSLLACICLPAMAQLSDGPQAAPLPAALPLPVNRRFAGTIHLNVDATDAAHAVFRIAETIPVGQSAGDLVLLYPEWETTSHSPTASVAELAGLQVQSGGRELPWHRDPYDVHAFHVTVPAGAAALSLTFDYLPRSAAELRPGMVDVQWQRVLLYPAGWYARDLTVAATLLLSADLHAYAALAVAERSTIAPSGTSTDSAKQQITFSPQPLDRLVDAPVYAGRNVQQIDLSADPQRPVHLDLLADDASDLAVEPAVLTQLRTLIVQTEKVFGAPPFARYEALVSLSDELAPGGGQEHLEEGENNLPAHFFTDYARQLGNRDLIAHEYVHAWNGRYRQPAGLWSPTYNRPTDASLLWVYEGQTEFWGRVLAARAGMRSEAETLDKLALDAATVAARPGRSWKNLADSSLDALYMPGHALSWRDWQRREDYYPEGVLLWLDVDARLRELSAGKFGLDDFARRFFAVHASPAATSLYTFDDVCAALDALAPQDWAAFLREHLLTHDTDEAMGGLARAGWRLVYTTTPTESFLQEEAEAGVMDVTASIGLQIRKNGVVRAVAWDGPAFQAGLRPGVEVRTVNGKAFAPESLLTAIEQSAAVPIHFVVRSADGDRDVRFPYAGGPRYPRLARIPGSPDRLTPLLQRR